MLSSFAVLKGPKAFLGILIERSKLPWSSAYVVGLVGTLVSTIILKSYLLTAFFGLLQVIALLYFLASFVPGGKTFLNFLGRMGRKLMEKCGRGALSQATGAVRGRGTG